MTTDLNDFSNDLSEFSKSYYKEANVYKLFSDSEDKDGFIWDVLKHRFENRSVLDLGCGNGRYLDLIETVSSFSVGVDQSFEQIKQGNSNLPFIVSEGCSLPFAEKTFDCVVSCWVWGTIADENKRSKILNEAKRVTKNGGSIFLVENDNPSEFEYYRGRHLNQNTQQYNNWILNNDFKILKKLETFISFDNLELAQYVFQKIWRDRLFKLPTCSKIQNNVIVFELKID